MPQDGTWMRSLPTEAAAAATRATCSHDFADDSVDDVKRRDGCRRDVMLQDVFAERVPGGCEKRNHGYG
jgi:hypothetical protein